MRILKDLDESIDGKDVLVVEDIVDTGLTLQYLLQNLRARNPESLKIVALLSKPSRREIEVQVDYVGFEIPDDFVVGYGLDYSQKYRNLAGYLHPSIREKRQGISRIITDKKERLIGPSCSCHKFGKVGKGAQVYKGVEDRYHGGVFRI